MATREIIEMWFFKVILLGAPRLGKTTVRRRLTGEIQDISSASEGENPSTGAVESGHSVVIRNLSSTTALVTPSQWLATKDLTDEARMFLQYFHSHMQEKKAAEIKPSENKPAENKPAEIINEEPEVKSKVSVKRASIKRSSTKQASTRSRGKRADVKSTTVKKEAKSPKKWSKLLFWRKKKHPSSPEHCAELPAESVSNVHQDGTHFRSELEIPEMIRNAVSPTVLEGDHTILQGYRSG